MTTLTANAVMSILNGVDKNVLTPVMQCLDVRLLKKGEDGPERYRLVLSDGQHFQQAMLSTNLNPMVQGGAVTINSIIRLDDFLCNEYQGRRIIIVTALTVLGNEPRIGMPRKIEEASEGAPSISRPATAAPAASSSVPVPAASAPAASSAAPVPVAPSYRSNVPPHASGPIVRQKESNVVPIDSLNLYSGKWTIKARVTNKSGIRTWSNARGDGKLFSIDLLDDSNGEIKATIFQEAVDMYYDKIVTEKVYYITGGQVKHANPQFNTLKNDYELSLDRNTVIEAAPEDDSIPRIQYHFADVEKLLSVDVNSTVDVLGVIMDIGDVSQFVSQRSGKEMIRRVVTIADKTLRSVDITLWGDTATNFGGQVGQVIAVKGCRVGDFNGRSLSASFGSVLSLDPELPEAYSLKDWFNQKITQGPLHTTPLSMDSAGRGAGGMGGGTARKPLNAVETEHLGHGAKPDYFTSRAWVLFIRESNLYYQSCAAEGCQKKVVASPDGMFECEKCGHRDSRCDYRYIVSAQVCDHTGSQWVTCFNNEGEVLLGVTANEIADLENQHNEEAKRSLLDKRVMHGFVFKIRCKAEDAQGEQRIRCTAASVEPVNFVQECRHLLQDIKAYGL